MSRVMSTEVWLSDIEESHKDKHDYRKAVYVNASTKIEIICKVHGTSFWQTPYSHRKGAGCPECNKTGGKTTRLTQDEFIQRSIAADGAEYGHELVKYKNSITKVDIVCPKHGVFSMLPLNRQRGQQCPKCSFVTRGDKSAKTHDQFKAECANLEERGYNYDKVVYKGDRVKVTVVCPHHGDFQIAPSNLLQGQGCPKCMKCGYNTSKAGYLYIFGTDKADDTVKVGITNRNPVTRAKEVSKSSGKKFHVIAHMYFKDGALARNIEVVAHNWLSERYSKTTELFNGSTECFSSVNLGDLITFLLPLAPPESAQADQT